MYNLEIIPLLEGKKQLPDIGADWVFRNLTLTRIVSPNDYERVKELILAQVHFMEGRNEPNIIEYMTRIDEIIANINQLDRSVIFLGDGVPVFNEYIQENCKVPFSFAPAHMNKQRGAAVAALAFLCVEEGKVQTAAGHRPDYLRLSQAERERLAQEQQS